MKTKFNKSIKRKILQVVLPFLGLFLVLIATAGSLVGRRIITIEFKQCMLSELKANVKNINEYVSQFSYTATNLSNSVASTYQTTNLASYETMLRSYVESNDSILGCGIWFEPSVFNKDKYMGPYAQRENDSINITYEYSNEIYNYFNQEYYLIAKKISPDNKNQKYAITNPYYDETMKATIATIVSPIYDNGMYKGCVTIDMDLSNIVSLISEIEIGQTGDAILIDSTGNIMGAKDFTSIKDKSDIAKNESIGLKDHASTILQNNNGELDAISMGEEYHIYYDSIDNTKSSNGSWKLLIRITQAEVNKPVFIMFGTMISISLFAMIAVSLVIFLRVRKIANVLKETSKELLSLSEGNLNININEKSLSDKTEIGEISHSLMILKNELVGILSRLNDSSENLHSTSSDFSNAFFSINENIKHINVAIAEISSGSTNQAQETQKAAEAISDMSCAIDRNIINEKSLQLSTQHMRDINGKLNETLNELMQMNDGTLHHMDTVKIQTHSTNESAKKIQRAVEMIQGIANQTNLLSLNASIEASRAGDAGRGFSVVAEEIRKLSESSKESACEINEIAKELIGNSDQAVEKMQALSENANSEKEKLIESSERFISLNLEIKNIADSSLEISKQTDILDKIRNTVREVIEQLAAISEENASSTEETSANTHILMQSVESCAIKTKKLSELSDSLKEDTKRFIHE